MAARLGMFGLLVASVFHGGAGDAKTKTMPSNGAYSSHAVRIWDANAGTVPSPDGRKAITVRPPRQSTPGDENHYVVVSAFGRTYPTRIGEWVNAEVAWSPDSTAFFATYSDGGNLGAYHVVVFYVSPSGLRIIEPVRNGRRLFKPTCFDPEQPNIAGVKWTGADSSRLLIAAEAPPHSSCSDMGMFRLFELALPNGRVLATHSERSSKKLFWNDLGSALRNGEDR